MKPKCPLFALVGALGFLLCVPAFSANYLINPGFEDGLNGWATTGGATVRDFDPTAYQGQYYIYAPNSERFTVSQTVDLALAGFAPADIDAGLFSVHYGGYQAGWNEQQDAGQISLSFYAADTTKISGVALPWFYSNHTWVRQEETVLLPALTRSIEYHFEGVRAEGLNDDGYLDAAFLEISAIPEPQMFLTVAAALLFGWVSASRRRQ